MATKVDQSDRLELILKLLSLGSKLETSEIAERISRQVNEENSDSFRKKTQRDLNLLIEKGKVQYQSLSRSDEVLSVDAESLEYKRIYFLKENDSIHGEKLLSDKGISLLYSAGIRPFISVNTEPAENKKILKIQFPSLDSKDTICIDQSGIPLKILVTRSADNLQKHFASAEAIYGKRLLMISVANRDVSSGAANGKYGHLIISLTESEIIVTDLDSTNGTNLFPVSKENFSQFKESVSNRNKTTRLGTITARDFGEKQIKIGKDNLKILPPCLMTLGTQFPIVLFY